MAEKEKRRATTFVTSRGAIINVAAPSVYIAPGVTPVDVTSPAELREELDIHSMLSAEKLMREGVDAHFNCRTMTVGAPAVRVWQIDTAGKYWIQEEYAGQFPGYLISPKTIRSVAIYSKNSFKYPVFSCRAILPTLAAGEATFFGLEDSSYGNVAAFAGDISAGAERLRILMGPPQGAWREVDITNLLPANAKTAQNNYRIELGRSMATFYINNLVIAYGLITPNSYITPILGPPYGLFSTETFVARSLSTLLEFGGLGVEKRFEVSPYGFRVSEGDPSPPRVMRLYATNTNNLLAGLAVTPNVTSHPFPVFGYPSKTIHLRADEAGTLSIQVLTQAGNWRGYDSVPVVANTLLSYIMTGDATLARVVFTPTTPPATITDAEVVLR